MNKLNMVLAGAVALVFTGAALADQPRDDRSRQDPTQQRNDRSRGVNQTERDDQTRQEQPGADVSGNQQVQPESDALRRAEEYSAELKKCDQLDDDRKIPCIESVNKKFGQM